MSEEAPPERRNLPRVISGSGAREARPSRRNALRPGLEEAHAEVVTDKAFLDSLTAKGGGLAAAPRRNGASWAAMRCWRRSLDVLRD